MPKRTLPRVADVAPGKAPLTLRVSWQHGGESLVDVSGLVGALRVYAPLREDRALFRRVRVGEHGTDVAWTDETDAGRQSEPDAERQSEIDMAADTLWRLAREQSGETLTAEAFRAWRERKAYTLDGAARALGLSRRMVAYYEQGERPIPRTVTLATRALEMADPDSEQAA